MFVSTDEGIFKAGEERSETRGAAEVQEDEDTQVEVPVDQVIFMPLNSHSHVPLLPIHAGVKGSFEVWHSTPSTSWHLPESIRLPLLNAEMVCS